jgi:poly(glycerol-phosphate) alpha-glucosyltransferase
LTPGCNFPEASKAGAAVEVDPDEADIAEGLRHLLAMTDHHRRAMGLRGRAMVEQSYTWDHAAQKTLELYRWLGSGGLRPAFVEPSEP